MSQLIDKLIQEHSSEWPRSEVNHRWYFSKPYQMRSLLLSISDAWRVFTGRSIAVHYAVDDYYVQAKEPR